jgi:predicted nucleic acid-binding protein
MRWCFEGASHSYAEAVLDRIRSGTQAYVPVLWLYEVVSVLAAAQKVGSITPEKAAGFLEDLDALNIIVDDEGFDCIFADVHHLAVANRLTGYDAVYLELAARKGLPLASLDSDLNKAAVTANVCLVV